MFERLPLPSQFDRIIVTGTTVVALVGLPILIVLLVLLTAGQISGAELVFWMASAVIVAGALGAVLVPNVVHAALALVATLLGVAAIFLLLATEFIALVQVLVYGGGVVILLLFGLMLTNAADDPVVTDGSQKPFAALVGVLLIGIFAAAALDAEWAGDVANIVPFELFGERLFRDFLVPVIVVAILLDIALTGAFVNARRERVEEPAADEEVRA
ncbi:MAG: NADH-quinone oxidoreductase subunit J [Dehalococcoidia bacterium]|nr:NADH-quinone oxidoreductase subunit J [Dehalococcoidia bacterium]